MLLHHKVELALVAYITANRANLLPGVSIVPAHIQERPDYPCLIVSCLRGSPHPDFAGCGRAFPQVVPAVFAFRENANDAPHETTLGAWSGALEGILAARVDDTAPRYAELLAADRLDYSDLLIALNPPATGPDTRVQPALYVHAIHPLEDHGDFDGEAWDENLALEFHAQNGVPS